MNVPLVESLVQVIISLSPEERALLEEKLHRKTTWRETLQRIDKLQAKISARRGGDPFEPPLEEYIWQTREERNQQIDGYFKPCNPPCLGYI